MPQVRLEVDGRRYFLSGDTVMVLGEGTEHTELGVVSDDVPVRLDDGTVITVPRDRLVHAPT